MKLSEHQRKVIKRMQQGEPIWMCILHIKTKKILEKKDLIKGMLLTDEGKELIL